MKRILVMLLCFVAFMLHASPVDELPAIYAEGKKLEGIFPRPASNPNGPKMLLLAGGRPWVGNDCGKLFASGVNLQLLNSCYLGGEGGAFIRITPSEKIEPTPVNAITGEFARLADYKLVAILGIPRKNQENILTQERRSQLEEYVRNGGNLMLSWGVPGDWGEILPVHMGSETRNQPGMRVVRPVSPAFSKLPEKWMLADPYRVVTAVEGAEVLTSIFDDSGKEVTPYLVLRKIGKGKVLYFNGDFTRRSGNMQFFTWAYRGIFLKSLAEYLTETSMGIKLPSRINVVPPATLQNVTENIALPEWGIKENENEISVDDRTLVFPNGYRLKVPKGKNSLEFYLPNETVPIVTKMSTPQLKYAPKQVAVESSSAEATDVKDSSIVRKIRWRFKEMTGGKVASIRWASPDGQNEMVQEFKCGTVTVDGVHYTGIAQRVRLVKSPSTISGIEITCDFAPHTGKIRRNACYNEPRGYVEYDIAGAKSIATGNWGFFSSGQPFSWLELNDTGLVYVDFPETAVAMTASFGKAEGTDQMFQHTFEYKLGYRQAPLETGFCWQLFAPAEAVANNNGWMAMYQFIRHHLRVVTGFPEYPAYPIAGYKDTSTQQEKEVTIAKMGKVGIKHCLMPWCPSEMANFDLPERKNDFRLLKEAGVHAYPWTPCGHSPGRPAGAKNFKDWFAYDPNGKVYTYFGGHYDVLDQSSPDFLDWYLPRMKEQIQQGVLGWWFDMGGAASDTINYAKPNSSNGLPNIIRIYKYLFDNGANAVTTEGANPLAIDGYIYRPSVYTPMVGKEYVFHGAMLPQDSGGHDFDYFRSSMFDTFYNMHFDNYQTGFETYFYEQEALDDVAHYVYGITKILDAVGMPFIRITPYGTTWISDKGAAVFCYDNVNYLNVNLPAGYTPVGMATEKEKWLPLNGKLPSSIQQRSMILFVKK